MGNQISTCAFGPDKDISRSSLLSTLAANGYKVVKHEGELVTIKDYGVYVIRYLYLSFHGEGVFQSTLERHGDS